MQARGAAASLAAIFLRLKAIEAAVAAPRQAMGLQRALPSQHGHPLTKAPVAPTAASTTAPPGPASTPVFLHPAEAPVAFLHPAEAPVAFTAAPPGPAFIPAVNLDAILTVEDLEAEQEAARDAAAQRTDAKAKADAPALAPSTPPCAPTTPPSPIADPSPAPPEAPREVPHVGSAPTPEEDSVRQWAIDEYGVVTGHVSEEAVRASLLQLSVNVAAVAQQPGGCSEDDLFEVLEDPLYLLYHFLREQL